MRKSPKSCSQNGFWFSYLLRQHASKNLVVVLLLFFLFGNLTLVSTKLDVDHCSDQQSSSAFSSLDESQELNSTPVEYREFYSCREVAENFSTPFLKIKGSLHQLKIVTLLISFEAFFSSDISSLPSTSPCKSLFSPRPPPLFSLQA